MNTQFSPPHIYNIYIIVVVQSLSHVQLFATPWTAARQVSLSFTISQSLLKLMSIESVIPSNHLFFCHPLFLLLSIFPASGSFLMSQLFASGGQSIGASASASVLPINIHDWLPLGLTGLISLQSKGLTSVFSNTTVRKHQLFGAQPSLWSNSHIHTWLLEKPQPGVSCHALLQGSSWPRDQTCVSYVSCIGRQFLYH